MQAAVLASGCGRRDEQGAPRGQGVETSAQSLVVEAGTSGLAPDALPGGSTTFVGQNPLSAHSADALSQAAANLGHEERVKFTVGNSFFTNAWVTAPASAAGRDGLGPLYNAAACQDCHLRDGRGHPPAEAAEAPTSALVFIALPDGRPDPVYGHQLQTRAIPGLPPEARVAVAWRARTETLPDGTRVSLRRPTLRLTGWAFGPPAPNLQASLRVAPAITGMGLLEAIPEADLRANAAAENALGLHGRVQETSVPAGAPASAGRFGWKAAKPTVRQQALYAIANDMGITSGLFPADACTAPERARGCARLPNGGTPELAAAIEDYLVFYTSHLAPPARRGEDRDEVRAGQHLFADIGCAGCHRPSWRTGRAAASPAASGQLIWPYTDLLLHDMGPGLADAVPEGVAAGPQWRTAPLWSLGQVKAVGGEEAGYLHDGRARTVTEAILWHGGEAKPSQAAWAALPAAQRRQVLAFLDSL